jgi:hypothetical protein
MNEKIDPPFHFKLNVTDTELVVMENTADRDTIAVILKATAILGYKAADSDKPLSCNITSLEVSLRKFSIYTVWPCYLFGLYFRLKLKKIC